MTSSFAPATSTVVDSILFRDAFGTQRMRDVFSDRAMIQRYIEVEVALARAEGRKEDARAHFRAAAEGFDAWAQPLDAERCRALAA